MKIIGNHKNYFNNHFKKDIRKNIFIFLIQEGWQQFFVESDFGRSVNFKNTKTGEVRSFPMDHRLSNTKNVSNAQATMFNYIIQNRKK